MEETGLTIRNVQFLTATNNVMLDENKHYVTVFVSGDICGDAVEPKVSLCFSPSFFFFFFVLGVDRLVYGDRWTDFGNS